nr:MAG TPA: hypothetical protein [Caudoviricetes sp.]
MKSHAHPHLKLKQTYPKWVGVLFRVYLIVAVMVKY